MTIAARTQPLLQTFPAPTQLFQSLYNSNLLDCRVCGHLLQQCSNLRLLRQGQQLHAHIVMNSITPNNFLASKLISLYSKTGHIIDARKVFDEIPHKNIFSWNAMFIAYTSHEQYRDTLKLFSSLVSLETVDSPKPDNFSVTSVLKALGALFPDVGLAKEIHCYVLRHGYECDLFVSNALLMFYAKCDDLGFARKLFDRMPKRDIVSWNSMIAGYSQHGWYKECLELYRNGIDGMGLKPDAVTMLSVLQACAQSNNLTFGSEVHVFIIENNVEVDVGLYNAIIGLYAKCGRLDYGRELFDEMKNKDHYSYNSMISGYMIHGFFGEAMELFREMKTPELSTWNAVLSGLVQNSQYADISELLREMQATGFRPNSVTLSSVLPAFSYYSNLKGGKQIHCYAIRNNYDRNVYVATAIIDLYAKAGFVDGANRVFTECKTKSVIVWTAIISAYSAHGYGEAALDLFNKMRKSGVKPDYVTITAVLAGCAHAGEVDKARELFDTMLPLYGINPTLEHYACMVGVLSRAGKLYEAAEFISKMGIEPNAKVWGALLNGVSVSGDVELGKVVCDRLFEIEPENTWNYVVMANLYSRAGRWEEAEKVRQKMNNTGLKKTAGCSWIETSNGLLSFIAGSDTNETMEEIFVVLDMLFDMMRDDELEDVSVYS
ncbi:hypothetical protein ACHQM5_030174 [Ranunculus cassubicifolius]